MENLKTWYIYGAGGLGRETMDIVLEMLINEGKCGIRTVFIDDKPTETSLAGFDVVDLATCTPGSWVTIAVGEPKLRAELKHKALSNGLILKTAISPSAFISRSVQIGDGSIIAPMCSLQSNAKVASNVSVNTMTIIGHDVVVCEDAVISSQVNLGGSTYIGARAYVGMGALVKEHVKIGERTIVSMGAVVHRDLPERVIAVGNPARVAKRNENEKVFK